VKTTLQMYTVELNKSNWTGGLDKSKGALGWTGGLDKFKGVVDVRPVDYHSPGVGSTHLC
jgi:hypothetical protein